MSPRIHVGRTFDWFEGRVDADAAAAYALATNDPNPCYQSGKAVPPLFSSSLIERSLVEAQTIAAEEGAVVGHRAGVHAEHDVTYHAPLLPEMPCRWRSTMRSARQTKAGAMVTLDVEIVDLDDRPLIRHLWSSMYVGGSFCDGALGENAGPDLADHEFPEAARDVVLAEVRVPVDRDQTFRYGGVSGDRPPHSMDDALARAEGFPRKIVQGQCTFAMCSGAIVAHAAGGDPERLRRLACRFSRPLSPGTELTVVLHDAGVTEGGLRAVAFEAYADGVAVIRHGRAELTPA